LASGFFCAPVVSGPLVAVFVVAGADVIGD
jgi:hypothetical protein